MNAPPAVVLLRPGGERLLNLDLGVDFLSETRVAPALWERPLTFELDERTSKMGNTYYERSAGGLPLPDGLATRVVVGGTEVALGAEHLSESGQPTRNGEAALFLDDVPAIARVFLTAGKRPMWLKIVVNRQPRRRVTVAPSFPDLPAIEEIPVPAELALSARRRADFIAGFELGYDYLRSRLTKA